MIDLIELKKLRLKLGLSQEALARILGVSMMTVSRWDRDKNQPSPMAQDKIREFLKKHE